MKRSLCVVLHDVASATLPACMRTIQAIREVADVPITLLAVPRYHCEPSSAAFGSWLRARSLNGDEVALHGYTHVDDGVPRNFVDRLRRRHYTRGEGEFCDLSLTEATQRITAGVRWFQKEGLTLRGFVAPAWLMSEGTWEALRWADLRYTCTLRRVVLLPEHRDLTSQSIVYSTSSAWRRQASVGWNAAVAATLKSNPLVRLELHPRDAEHAAVRRSWQRLLEKHLADRTPSTLAAVAEQFRIETDGDSLGHGVDIDLGSEAEGISSTSGQHVPKAPDPGAKRSHGPAYASICNDEQGSFGVMNGRDRKTLSLSENHQEKLGRHDSDRRTDGDVGRVMKAENHT